MTIQVTYPSGKVFTVHGTWRGPHRLLDSPNQLGTEADGVVVEDGDRVFVLDPRGTYVDVASGRVLYRGVQ